MIARHLQLLRISCFAKCVTVVSITSKGSILKLQMTKKGDKISLMDLCYAKKTGNKGTLGTDTKEMEKGIIVSVNFYKGSVLVMITVHTTTTCRSNKKITVHKFFGERNDYVRQFT